MCRRSFIQPDAQNLDRWGTAFLLMAWGSFFTPCLFFVGIPLVMAGLWMFQAWSIRAAWLFWLYGLILLFLSAAVLADFGIAPPILEWSGILAMPLLIVGMWQIGLLGLRAEGWIDGVARGRLQLPLILQWALLTIATLILTSLLLDSGNGFDWRELMALISLVAAGFLTSFHLMGLSEMCSYIRRTEHRTDHIAGMKD